MHPDSKNYNLVENIKKVITFSVFLGLSGVYMYGCPHEYKGVKDAVHYKDSVIHVKDSLEYRLK